MKPLSEMSHYEVLEVSRDAEPEEIERAYRLALATYGGDGLATYSLFEEDDAAALLERIETAWRVLSDPEARQAYDAELGGQEVPRPLEVALELVREEDPPRPEVAPSIPALDRLEDDREGSWDGPRLRRARLERGIDLEQIAKTTKINPSYLRFLEEEQFADLPAAVYVRGFVSAYARCVGLDPGRVVPGFMERFGAAASPPPRRGRAGRR
ncbi:MAG: helix-turn-helix domain-containing protein [Myxococcota bacterium]|nr:helix-turn-helix domain-containing protein [Myxococcota bacterium]